jgi:hypothetical protein
MPTKNSKIVSARIPNEIEFSIPVSRVLTSIYAGLKQGKLCIDKTGVVPMNDCDNCSKGLPQENDPDGEWVREIAHELNIDMKTFKRRIEQSIGR